MGQINTYRFQLKANKVLMTVSSQEYDYINVLYRFRNAIAHAGFKISDDEIFFCNRDKGKTMLRARIDRGNQLDGFMRELQSKIFSYENGD